ncbi:MAG: PEP-CTERM sorting domain-containing protein [Verrucomicrobiota bacterium]
MAALTPMKAEFPLKSIILYCITVTHCWAQTFSYTGSITSVFGDFSDDFNMGDTVNIAYQFDYSVMDSNSDPDVGNYFGATQLLTFSHLESGLSTNFSGGTTNIFNDTSNPDDQISILGFTAAETSFLGGEVITFTEFGASGSTSMLSDDSLPTNFIEGASTSFSLGTNSFFTQINVTISPVPEPSTYAMLFGLVALGGAVYFRGKKRL